MQEVNAPMPLSLPCLLLLPSCLLPLSPLFCPRTCYQPWATADEKERKGGDEGAAAVSTSHVYSEEKKKKDVGNFLRSNQIQFAA